MSPGAQSIDHICDLLMKKVVQSIEPEACAVYELRQSLKTSDPLCYMNCIGCHVQQSARAECRDRLQMAMP